MSNIPSPTDFTVVYLTWQSDPTTTMTVHWLNDGFYSHKTLFYRRIETSTWIKREGIKNILPDSGKGIVSNEVELTGLMQNETYEFRIGNQTTIRKFKTMPLNIQDQIKICVSSDTHQHETSDHFLSICREMAKLNPHFVVNVGDVTQDDGLIGDSAINQWVSLLGYYETELVRSDGTMIPVVYALGNHDTTQQRSGEYGRETARNFMRLLSFPTKYDYPNQMPGYGHLKFGDYLQLIVLDSDHMQHYNYQTGFIRDVIDADMTHIIPVYHRPAYSMRGGNVWTVDYIINNWLPYFYTAGVKAAFEGHNHSYVRSHPVKNYEVSEEGICHFGAGTWALLNRDGGTPAEPSWIADQKYRDIDPQNARHFYGVELYNDKIVINSINSQGSLFNTVERAVV